MYKGPRDKAKRGKDWGWEVGVGEEGGNGGKMETTVKNNKKNKRKKKKRNHSNFKYLGMILI